MIRNKDFAKADFRPKEQTTLCRMTVYFGSKGIAGLSTLKMEIFENLFPVNWIFKKFNLWFKSYESYSILGTFSTFRISFLKFAKIQCCRKKIFFKFIFDSKKPDQNLIYENFDFLFFQGIKSEISQNFGVEISRGGYGKFL